jgi:GNAT superfamily N-acetyltransferase
MQYAVEPLTLSLRQELKPLLAAHWREIAHFQDIPLNVDWETYHRASRDGLLRVFTARTEEGLAGYAVFFIRSNPHYQDSLQATQDVMFMSPEHRGRGGALISFAEAYLKVEGVQAVYQHVKDKFNFGPLLERLGYIPIERVWVKRLDTV